MGISPLKITIARTASMKASALKKTTGGHWSKIITVHTTTAKRTKRAACTQVNSSRLTPKLNRTTKAMRAISIVCRWQIMGLGTTPSANVRIRLLGQRDQRRFGPHPRPLSQRARGDFWPSPPVILPEGEGRFLALTPGPSPKGRGETFYATCASAPRSVMIWPSSLTSSKRTETCLVTPDSCIVTP